MIDLQSSIEVTKGWGKEVVIVNNDKYCGKILHFKNASKFSMHFHADKHETFYVLEGTGIMRGINTENANEFDIELKPGVIISIPQFSLHQIFAQTDMKVIEFSTHHEDSDSYRIIKGDSQK
jgi:mannose-6-phosphate isomerase-like protein (cupin superfamily)